MQSARCLIARDIYLEERVLNTLFNLAIRTIDILHARSERQQKKSWKQNLLPDVDAQNVFKRTASI